MAYNMTFMNNSNTLYDVAVGVNNASNNLISVFFLVIIFIIVLGFTYRFGEYTALLTASTVSTAFATLFLLMGMLPWTIAVIPIIFLVISLFIWLFG